MTMSAHAESRRAELGEHEGKLIAIHKLCKPDPAYERQLERDLLIARNLGRRALFEEESERISGESAELATMDGLSVALLKEPEKYPEIHAHGEAGLSHPASVAPLVRAGGDMLSVSSGACGWEWSQADVRACLIELGYRDHHGILLGDEHRTETQWSHAIMGFQLDQSLEATGVADAETCALAGALLCIERLKAT